MDWSGVDYCDVFISCLDSHSDGTHSLQSIHCWDTDAETHFFKPDEEINSSNLGWPEGEDIFSKCSFLGELFLSHLFEDKQLLIDERQTHVDKMSLGLILSRYYKLKQTRLTFRHLLTHKMMNALIQLFTVRWYALLMAVEILL